MSPIMKWTVSGVVYLALVIGGYYGYTAVTGEPDQHHMEHGSTQENREHQNHGGHEGHDTAAKENEVIPSLTIEEDELTVTLKDLKGNPLNDEDLEINHERRLHLIVVSRDLQQYEHLHPKFVGNGVFQAKVSLSPGSYKAFVDIQPKQLAYEATPLPLEVGENEREGPVGLNPDQEFTQTVGGTTVSMEPTTLAAGEPVTLVFSLKGGKPEPYLGAMGHVVILDEQAEKFVHVHPASDEKTEFTTKFERPGTYKIWAEFKIDGKVHVYSFVVEVK